MVSATRVPNKSAALSGHWHLRSVSRLGSIDHTISSSSCKFWHRLRALAVLGPEGARLAGIRTDLVTMGAHVVCSVSAGVTGLYLSSRLRSGAPWIGRDGVYDLESIAVVVI